MDIPTVEEFVALHAGNPEFKLAPWQVAFFKAMEEHPHSEGHQWRMVHRGRRAGMGWVCSKCKVPVGEPAPSS